MTVKSLNFFQERDLQVAMMEFCRSQWWSAPALPDSPLLLRREVPVGGVVPDLVAIHGDRAANVRLRRWSWRHAHLVHQIRRGGGMRPVTLSRLLFETEDRVRQTIRDLEEAQIVVVHRVGTVSLSEGYRRQETTITAFEAKLARWKEAFAQALIYRVFADRVVVVLPPGAADDVAVRQFRAAGVGLWTIGERQVEVVRPRSAKCRSAEREWLLGSTFLLNSQRRWVARNPANADAHAAT